MEDTPQRALVVTPHPDDAEIWCGGAVARWVKQGALVRYVLCSNGNKGSANREINPAELAATRELEQLDAARILGVESVVLLRHPDGELEDTADFRKELVREIRRLKPDVVLTTEPYRRHLAWHRDHRIAGQVALDAVFPYARDHLHFAELWRDEGLEPHKTPAILFWGADAPDTFIDIGETIERKIEAVKAHRSQVPDDPPGRVAKFIKERAAEMGQGQNLAYAEAFRKVTFRV